MYVPMSPSEMPGFSWRDLSGQLCVFFPGRSADGPQQGSKVSG